VLINVSTRNPKQYNAEQTAFTDENKEVQFSVHVIHLHNVTY